MVDVVLGHPDLDAELWRLLLEFEVELRRSGAPIVDNLAPGVEPERVRGLLAEIGMEPAQELLTWWAWHNGRIDPLSAGGGAHYLLQWLPFSVDEAIADWRMKGHGEEPWEWPAGWLPIGTPEAMPRLVVDCTPPQGRQCTVRMVRPDAGLFSEEARPRSLAWAVRYWTRLVREGHFVVVPPVDGHPGGWDLVNYLAIPLEDRSTGI